MIAYEDASDNKIDLMLVGPRFRDFMRHQDDRHLDDDNDVVAPNLSAGYTSPVDDMEEQLRIINKQWQNISVPDLTKRKSKVAFNEETSVIYYTPSPTFCTSTEEFRFDESLDSEDKEIATHQTMVQDQEEDTKTSNEKPSEKPKEGREDPINYEEMEKLMRKVTLMGCDPTYKEEEEEEEEIVMVSCLKLKEGRRALVRDYQAYKSDPSDMPIIYEGVTQDGELVSYAGVFKQKELMEEVQNRMRASGLRHFLTSEKDLPQEVPPGYVSDDDLYQEGWKEEEEEYYSAKSSDWSGYVAAGEASMEEWVITGQAKRNRGTKKKKSADYRSRAREGGGDGFSLKSQQTIMSSSLPPVPMPRKKSSGKSGSSNTTAKSQTQSETPPKQKAVIAPRRVPASTDIRAKFSETEVPLRDPSKPHQPYPMVRGKSFKEPFRPSVWSTTSMVPPRRTLAKSPALAQPVPPRTRLLRRGVVRTEVSKEACGALDDATKARRRMADEAFTRWLKSKITQNNLQRRWEHLKKVEEKGTEAEMSRISCDMAYKQWLHHKTMTTKQISGSRLAADAPPRSKTSRSSLQKKLDEKLMQTYKIYTAKRNVV